MLFMRATPIQRVFGLDVNCILFEFWKSAENETMLDLLFGEYSLDCNYR